MHTLPVDRALRIYATLANRSETKGSREKLTKHLMEKYIQGEKDEHRFDGGRTLIPSQHAPGSRFPKLAPQGFPLFPQGFAPRYFCLRDSDSVRPCWLSLRLHRHLGPSSRWHHRQRRRGHYRTLERLRSHWASGRSVFGMVDSSVLPIRSSGRGP
jgi:hypothetical protein